MSAQDAVPALQKLDESIRLSTASVVENMNYMEDSIKELKNELKELTVSVSEGNDASGELAKQANGLKVASIWIAVFALAIAAGHLAVYIQDIFKVF